MDAGGRPGAHAGATGPSSTPVPAATSRSPSPRGSPPTSPTSPRGCRAPASSSSSTSRRCPPSCRAACPPSAASASWRPSRRTSSSRSSPRSSPRCPAPVVVHCCAPRAPLDLFRAAGAGGALLRPRPRPGPRRRRHRDRGRHPPVPRRRPRHRHGPARRRRRRRPGCRPGGGSSASPPTQLAGAVTLTPSCGLAGATPAYARTAMAHVREAAKYLPCPSDRTRRAELRVSVSGRTYDRHVDEMSRPARPGGRVGIWSARRRAGRPTARSPGRPPCGRGGWPSSPPPVPPRLTGSPVSRGP